MIKQPYPYFGGKATIMPDVFARFGYTPNFIDPFFGGGSALWMNKAFDWEAGLWRSCTTYKNTAAVAFNIAALLIKVLLP